MKAHEHHRLCRDLAGTDWRVGQPKRLSILVALEHHGQLTFSGLGRVTDRSPGNLAAHLGRLEEFGYVTIARDELVVGRAMRTTATIPQPGITALERHFENLKVLGIRLGALIGAGSGSRGEAGHPSPSDRRRRKVYRYYE